MWCEFCRDHYDDDHFDEHGIHGLGEGYGPYGRLLALEDFAEAIAGEGATITRNAPGSLMFEVRRAGKHVGFVDVVEGEVRHVR